MAASAFVIIHDNPFNKSVVSSNNYSFANKEQLIELLENEKILSERDKIADENINIINNSYRWEKIVDQYENYF